MFKNKFLGIISIVFIFLFVTSPVLAGSPLQPPETCTIWDDFLDIFVEIDCGTLYEIPRMEKVHLGTSWIQYQIEGDYKVIIKDKYNKDTEISFISKSAKSLNDLSNTLTIQTDKGSKELTKETKKGEHGYTISTKGETRISFNPTILFQEQSMIQYIEGDLEINTTLKKWNGLEFVIAPEDVWIDENNNSFKFGANDSVATEDTNYKYLWESNQEIKEDEKGYYVRQDTYTIGHRTIYERKYIDTSDICIENANCSFDLNNNTLEVEFIGFYNSTLGMVFIDPSYTVSYDEDSALLTDNTKVRGDFTHLEIDNSTEPYSHLVGYWNFDGDDNTTAYDFTNYDNDGTYVENAYASNSGGIYDNALVLDGDKDYVTIPNDASLKPNNFTYSIWIKTSDLTTQVFFDEYSGSTGGDSNYRGTGLAVVSNKARTFIRKVPNSATGIYSTTDVNNGLWHNIISTYNGTILKLYVDGVEENTLETTNYEPSTEPLCIGCRSDTETLDFRGSLDEAMIFSIALNQTQITELYNNQSARFKSEGNTTLPQVTLNETANKVNITLSSSKEDFNSNLTGKLGYWNITSGYDNSDFDGYNGLVGYWHGDGNANDNSGNGNDGTFNGNANADGTGVYNSSFEFDGDGDYVNVDSVAGDVSSDDMGTVSVWVKSFEDDSSTAYWFSVGIDNTDSVFIQGLYLGNFYNSFRVSGITRWIARSTSNMDDYNKWNHYVVVQDGIEPKIYINGIEIATTFDISADKTMWFDDGGTYDLGTIGASDWHNYGKGIYFNGSIDEVMIFNRSLSEDEIKELYVKGKANWEYTNTSDFIDNKAEFTLDSNATNILPIINLTTPDNWYTPLAWLNNINISYEYQAPIIPNEPPVVNTTYPEATTYTTLISNFNYTVTDDNVTSMCWYSTNNGVTNSTPITAGQNFTGVSSSEGSNTWIVYCNDTLGLEGSDSITFTIDFPPSLTVTNPTNTSYTSTGIDITGSCTDGGSVDRLQYILDGGIPTDFTFTTQINTTGYEVYHTLLIECEDDATQVSSVFRKFYVGITNNGTAVPINLETCKYKKLEYYDLRLPWAREKRCI